eukprot:572687-Prymnesium_polylepis.1
MCIRDRCKAHPPNHGGHNGSGRSPPPAPIHPGREPTLCPATWCNRRCPPLANHEVRTRQPADLKLN